MRQVSSYRAVDAIILRTDLKISFFLLQNWVSDFELAWDVDVLSNTHLCARQPIEPSECRDSSTLYNQLFSLEARSL